MNSKDLLKSIGDLIGKDKINEALTILKDLFINNQNLSEVIFQKGRLSALEDDIRKGQIDFSTASIEKNKIRLAILNLLNNIEEEIGIDERLKNNLDSYFSKNIIILNQENYGEGDNINAPSALIVTKNQSGGKNTVIAKKVGIPNPVISLKQIDYIDKPVVEDLIKENPKLSAFNQNPLFKTFLIFNFNSQIQRSNIDFKVNSSSIYHVTMKYGQGIYETTNWETAGKIKGKRFFNPQNGTYEMTIYTEIPLRNIWDFIRVYMNDIEAIIEK